MAQEFGLIVVIIAMMLGLTAYTHLKGGPISKVEIVQVPTGATASTPAENGDFSITAQGKTTAYKAADGFELRGSSAAPIVRRTSEVNKFLNSENIMSVLTSASFIAVMAVGMTGIIVMGGIDLSVGSIYALAAICGAMAIQRFAPGTDAEPASLLATLPIALVVCCGAGAICGLINGMATVGLKVHPFIITLGGMAVYRGIAFVSTDGQTIFGSPTLQAQAIKLDVAGLTPVPVIIMMLIAGAGVFVFSRTVFGRRVFAIGGNEVAAKYAGIPVGRVKIILFVLNGLLAGLGAMMYLGYYGAASSDAAKGYELNVIAAAVVGGASLSGGRGSALGAVLGAIVIQLIENSIVMIGISNQYKEIVIGLAIVTAVVVDQAKHRLGAKR